MGAAAKMRIELSTHERSVININPQEILGDWRAGYALDLHSLSSRLLPDGRYDTERTEIGEMVYQVKYHSNQSKIQPLAEIAGKFVKEEFAVDGHLVLRYLAAVIPVPPSDLTRDFQPVTEIAKEMGQMLNLPVYTDYLRKVKQTDLLKNLQNVDSKREELRGAFVIQSPVLRGKVVLLIDDLYDSGATLTELTDVLHKQGDVYRVLVLTLTRTRRKDA